MPARGVSRAVSEGPSSGRTGIRQGTAEGGCPPDLAAKLDSLWRLVGNTPMLSIEYRYRGQVRRVFAKTEHYNLTGSIKDRMALYVLERAYRGGAIRQGDVIVEATSGNTGISFSAIGKALGHPVRIIMPNWLSQERMNIIRSLAAEVVLVSKEE